MAQGYSYIISLKLRLVFNVTSYACITDVFLKTKRTYYGFENSISLLDVHVINLHKPLHFMCWCPALQQTNLIIYRRASLLNVT